MFICIGRCLDLPGSRPKCFDHNILYIIMILFTLHLKQHFMHERKQPLSDSSFLTIEVLNGCDLCISMCKVKPTAAMRQHHLQLSRISTVSITRHVLNLQKRWVHNNINILYLRPFNFLAVPCDL